MNRLVLLAAAVACCTVHAVAPAHAHAEPTPSDHASIFQLNVVIDATVIGTGVALAIAPPLLADGVVTPSCPCDRDSVNAIDRGTIGNSSSTAATISDVSVITAVAGPAVFELATLGASRAFVEDMIVFGQTVLVSNALANLVKLAVQRPRPETYATTDRTELEATGGYLSFYSGHTTLTFAALSATSMILHLRYGTGVWPWIATLLIGSSVAIERVLAGKHFPTDVAVGAITGVAEGVGVPYLHVKRASDTTYGFALLPIANGAQLVFQRAL